MLRLVSTYRAQLMAFALLGVLVTHTNTDFGWFPLNRLAAIGYGGVDIFFFLSGLGLYFSFERNPNTGAFLRRRFSRIYPAYLLALLLSYALQGGFSVYDFIGKATMIGFFTPMSLRWHTFAWFVSAIAALYLIYPAFHRILRSRPHTAMAGVLAISLLLVAEYIYYHSILTAGARNGLILFFSRIPIFALGAYTGRRLYHAPRNPESGADWKGVLWTTAGFAAGMALLNGLLNHLGYDTLRNYGLMFFPFVLIVPTFCILMATLLCRCPRRVNDILKFFGSITLESYMMMSLLFRYKPQFVKITSGSEIGGTVLMIAAVIAAGWLLHRFVALLTAIIPEKKR